MKWDRDQMWCDDPVRTLSCGALAAREKRNTFTLKSGHAAASREAVRQSGRPIAELAAEHRAFSERLREAYATQGATPQN